MHIRYKATTVYRKLFHTLRLVDELVSINPGGGRVPGYPEAGVPLIRNTEIPGAEHTHCGERDRAAQSARASVYCSEMQALSLFSVYSLLVNCQQRNYCIIAHCEL